MELEEKIDIQVGTSLNLVSSRQKGPMAETDIYMYSIIDPSGQIVGTVLHTDHTPLDGRGRIQTVVQKDSNGEVVLEKHW